MNKKQMLLDAIDKATGFKECEYLDDSDKPCCPIGVLAVARGVPTQAIRDWEGEKVASVKCSHAESILDDYSRVVSTVQHSWDNGWHGLSFADEDYTRKKLKKYVEDHVS